MNGRVVLAGLWLWLMGCGCSGGGAGSATPIEVPTPEPERTAAPSPSPRSPHPTSGKRLVRIEVESDLGGVKATTIHRWVYDARGNVVRKEVDFGDGQPRITAFAYDAEGREVSIDTNPGGELGSATTIEHDAQGRRTKSCSFQRVGVLTVMPNNSCQELVYDAKGRVSEERTWLFSRQEVPAGAKPMVVVVRYEEDASGRVVTEAREQDGKRISEKHFRYDSAGRVVEETFDALHTPFVEERKVFERAADGSVVRQIRTRAGEEKAVFEYEGGEIVRATGVLPDEAMRHSSQSVARYSYQ